MSYIEEKYFKNIIDVFKELSLIDRVIYDLLEKKSMKNVDQIAQNSSLLNKKLNLILKKYYPEIQDLEKKLYIKSTMKFYYDFLDKLSDYIRNVETFRTIDENYYNIFLEFIDDKELLIKNKYTPIVRQELTSFYDKTSRARLEKVLEQKLKLHNQEYFTFGSLEEEIKKLARIAGADNVQIFNFHKYFKSFDLIENPKTIIYYSVQIRDETLLEKIGRVIKNYLLSKKFQAVILMVQFDDLDTNTDILTGSVITDANLLPDK